MSGVGSTEPPGSEGGGSAGAGGGTSEDKGELDELPASPEDDLLLGTVAIVGFPNVGKSTLVNRLTETRAAVVHETSGTTRDRKELVCEWAGKRFLVIDTGGVDVAAKDPIARSIVEQARLAVADADLVLFLVDARAGVTPGDEELAAIVRNSHKPVLVVANKIDDPAQESLALEFHRLGLGDPVPLSGMHGHNTGDLLDEIVARLEDTAEARPHPPDDAAIRVAILGRPNVGKSSLFNALVGAERTIVSDVPGTTRDAIDTVVEHEGRTFRLIDTAGLRRKRKQRQGIEYFSELRALQAAERADVALVLVDSSQGIVEGDLAAADVARKAQCSTLVVLAKWDISQVTIEDVRPQLQRRLRQRPPFITTSAVTGRGITRVLAKVAELYDKHAGRIATAELNRFLGELREARQPPSRGRKKLNLLYGAQVTSRPPRFRFTVNDTSLVTRDYGYWVENELRERFALEGVPVAIDFRRRS
jgi:GTP-binding protein